MKKRGLRVAFARFMQDPKRYIRAFKDWKKLVDEGSDPIEALSGHKCGPGCWHNMGKVKRGH